MLGAPKRVIIPRDGFEPVVFEPKRWQLTDSGWDWLKDELRSGRLRWRNNRPPLLGGSGQLSSWAEQTAINHLTGEDNAAWSNLSPVYLAQCTVLPTSSSTGSTITEATYTTYARTSIANTSWGAASGTAPASGTNTGIITGAACTALTSTVIGLAICTAATVGNVIMWCSCPSVVISSVQTPPTIAASALTVGLT